MRTSDSAMFSMTKPTHAGHGPTAVLLGRGGVEVIPPSIPPNHSLHQNITDGSGKDDKDFLSLADFLWVYVAPFIFVIGLVGNILIMVVMSRRKFQGTSTSVYLRLMAVADSLVLVSGMIPEWLEASHILIFKEIHPGTCKFEKFVTYTLGDIAIWILVAFTMDRFIAVVFPLEKSAICKPRRAYTYCLVLVFLAIAKNFHVIWTRGAQYEEENGVLKLVKNCGRPSDRAMYFSKFIRPWIAFTLVSVLPFLIIMVCNVMIIRTLIKAREMHKKQKVKSAASKTYMQMTAMCLSASFAFLIFITPSIVLLIGKPHWTSSKNPNVAYDISKAINNQLVYVNHSINFFLYCVTGQRFRQELLYICGKRPPPGFSGSQDDISQDSRTTLYRISSSKNAHRIYHQVNGNRPSLDIKYTKVDSKSGVESSV